MIDFEKASKNAFIKVFGQIPIRHCLFHLGQSINRYVMAHAFSNIYQRQERFWKLVWCLIALSLLPVNKVLPVYDLLLIKAQKLDIDENIESIFFYFKWLLIINDGIVGFPIDWGGLCYKNKTISS